MLRWILVEAASSAMRRPGPLQRHFRKLTAKRGKSVAKVAVARKMLADRLEEKKKKRRKS